MIKLTKSKAVQVTKYHGCGNDFIILSEQDIQGMDLQKFIPSVCDRHTGIGADGLIVVRENPLTMDFYNQDASVAPMCGNGIRCFAKYCMDEGIKTEDTFEVRTLAGVKTVQIVHRNPFFARIGMGFADYSPEAIDADSVSPVWDYPLKIGQNEVKVFSAFVSTTHTMVFVKDVWAKEIPALGEAICHHPLYMRKTNANMVEIVDRETVRIRTYERGVGMTLACGTGACASVLCAFKLGFTENRVKVILPKGNLLIEVMDDESLFMTGESKQILKGEYRYVED